MTTCDLIEYGVGRITIDEDGLWVFYYTDMGECGNMVEKRSSSYCYEDISILIKHRLMKGKEIWKDRIRELK